MRQEQITNEADGESIRATRHDDGTIVVEWSRCDADGHPTDFGWVELARCPPDGSIDYADGRGGESWTDARTATVNDVLRLL
jgi:hypothetical protein